MAEELDLTPTHEDNRPAMIFPSLVIGLGGTGVKSLRYFRRRLKEEFGPKIEAEPPLIQLLGVDTVPLENRSSMEALHQHEYAYVGGFNARRVIENLDRFEEIQRWWDWDSTQGLPLGYISTGAKQLRTIGRLAFYRRFHNYNSRLEAKLNRLASIQSHQKMHEGGRHQKMHGGGRPTQDQINLPHVFIVSSLAGGTGSGTFLDIACHLRNKLQDQARIIGILVMPSVFEEDIPSLLQQRRIRANAYAALAELDYFQSGGEFTTKFPEQDEFVLHGGAFTHIFLVDRPNVAGFQVSTQDDVQQLIADSIFQMTITPMAGRIWEMDANISREQHEGKSLAYSALGFSSLAVNNHERAENLLSSHMDALINAVKGPNDRNTIHTELVKVTEAIKDKAGEHSRGLSRSKAQPVDVYGKEMRKDCYDIILKAIKDNPGWGIQGAYYFVGELGKHYAGHLDAPDGQKPSFGQNEEARLRKAFDDASDKEDKANNKQNRSLRDIILNRDPVNEATENRKRVAERKRADAQIELDRFLLIKNGVAPDLDGMLRRLYDELGKALTGLTDVRSKLTKPTAPPAPTYPLRTFAELPPGYSPSVNGSGQGEQLEVREAARKLVTSWMIVNEPGSNPMIDLQYGRSEDAQRILIAGARELTQLSTQKLASLYDILVQKSNFNREEVHDLLRDFIRRCVPFCHLDFDRHNFSEKNIEPVYLLCLPPRLKDEYVSESSVFWALATSDYDFEPTEKPGREDRIDALCVSHGYPLWVFADLPTMYNEYISPDLGASPLHLQCCWRWKMPKVHKLTDDEKERVEKLEQERDPSFRRLCRECGDVTGKPTDAKPTSSGASRSRTTRKLD